MDRHFDSEADELGRLARGDEDAWTAFWVSYAPRLEAIARRQLLAFGLTGPQAADVAEELAAECALHTLKGVSEGRVTRGARRYAAGVVRNLIRKWAGRHRAQRLAEDEANGTGSLLEALGVREEVDRVLQRVRRSLNRVHDGVMLDMRDPTYRRSFRSAPGLHLLCLDLAADARTALAEVGRHVGTEVPSQVSKLRAAAEARALEVLKAELGRLPREGFLRQEAFGRIWQDVGAGCVEDVEVARAPMEADREDLIRHRRVHLETVGCEVCRAVASPDAARVARAERLALVLSRSTSLSLRARST